MHPPSTSTSASPSPRSPASPWASTSSRSDRDRDSRMTQDPNDEAAWSRFFLHLVVLRHATLAATLAILRELIQEIEKG